LCLKNCHHDEREDIAFSSITSTDKLPPTASVNCSLLFCDLRETRFVIFGIFLDGPFYFPKQVAMEFFLRDAIAQEKHRVRFTPIFAIFPSLNGVAAHLLRQVYQPRIINVVA